MEFDLFTFLASLFNFVVLLVLLRIFLFKRVTRAMDEREQRIADTWDEAEEARNEADEQREHYESEQEALEAEREDLIVAARQRADEERERRLEAIRQEIEEKRRQWLEDLRDESEELTRAISKRVSEITAESTERILSELADRSLCDQIAHVVSTRIRGEWADELGALEPEGAVQIVSSHELSHESRQELETALAETAHTDAPSYEVETELVGGVRIELGSQELGFSVRDQLSAMSARIDDAVTQGVDGSHER